MGRKYYLDPTTGEKIYIRPTVGKAQVKDVKVDGASVLDSNRIANITGKQNTLVSGTNIKTINGQSILGPGNIEVGSADDVYESIKVENISTVGALRTYIDQKNSEGKHFLFDFSNYVSGAYVCLVQTYTTDGVNYLWIKDLLNNKKYGSYTGYADTTTVANYISGVNKQTEVYSIELNDRAMTEADMFDYLAGINNKGDSVFINVASMQVPMYLCTITIDSGKTKIRINDLVTGRKYISSYEANKTIYDCLQAATEDSAVLSVNCKPSDVTDTTVLTGIAVKVYDSTGSLLAEKTYNGTTVEFPLPIYQTYKISVDNSKTVGGTVYFAPTTSDAAEGTLAANTTVTYKYDSTLHITSMAGAKTFINLPDVSLETKKLALVATETNAFTFDLELTNPENSTKYTMPHRILEIGTFERKLEDGTTEQFTGALCQPIYTIVSKQFDQREQVETEAGEKFSADLMYFSAASAGVGDKVFTKLTAGADYSIGDDIDTYKSTNNVYVYKNGLKNNSGAFAADANSIRYGSNIYHYSNVHKWLNGIGDDWFESSYTGDRCDYTDVKGYKSWFKSSDLNLIEDNVAWGVYERAGFELPNNKLYCKFALPSVTNFAGSANANEGNVSEYWKYLNGNTVGNAANDNRTITSITAKSSKQYMWFRSPNRFESFIALRLNTSGYVNLINAYYSYGFAPLFVI